MWEENEMTHLEVYDNLLDESATLDTIVTEFENLEGVVY